VPIGVDAPYDVKAVSVELARGTTEVSGDVKPPPASPAHPRVVTARAKHPAALDHVDIAVLRLGRGVKAAAKKQPRCMWAANARARFKRGPATGGVCATPRWLRARGTTHWRYRFNRRLPKGRYVLYVRAVDNAGVYDAAFTRHKHNKLPFTVR
jgi:hypothetical protein